jgi:hypothetical protein
MPSTGNNPKDVPTLLAMSAGALSRPTCTCGCGCCATDAPFGRPPPPGPTDEALRQRLRYVERLVPEARALLDTAREALAAGATTAAEIRDMQQLELWFGRLLVEQALETPKKKR